MKIRKNYLKMVDNLKKAESLPLLLIRLVLAYGFYEPAKKKIINFNGIISWFESINIPAPTLNAALATGAESLGVVLLFLGLGTRIISIPLIVTMIVAIITVHSGNGFEAGNNGFEIPLYYLIMLITLVVFGGGKLSLDYIFREKTEKQA